MAAGRILVKVREDWPADALRVYLVREGEQGRELMRFRELEGGDVFGAWELVDDSVVEPGPTFSLPNRAAQPLLDALREAIEGTSPPEVFSREQLALEQGRVDKLLDALIAGRQGS